MKKLLLAFCVFFSVLGNAQTWTNYTKANTAKKLAGKNVYSIAQDKDSVMWFGTENGVSKFDGTNWTNYTIVEGLVGNSVYSIAIDEQGIKWFGTENGVSKFDGINWTNFTELTGLFISAISIDNDGNKWFGTDGGVSKFDGTTWTKYTVTSNGLISNRVYSIYIDNQGAKWFGTKGGVSSFDGIVWYNNPLSNLIIEQEVHSIAIDNQGTEWLGTSDGVVEQGKTSYRYKVGSSGLMNSYVHSIVIDNDGYKWFGTNGGVSKFNGTTWTTYTKVNGLADDVVNVIFIDYQGNKWFGTANGVSKFNGTFWNTYLFESGLVSEKINTIVNDAQSNKWIGTDDSGVSMFDGKNWTTYNTSHGLADNEVRAIAIDAQGTKWFGTAKGVSRFDGISWITYNTTNGLIDNSVNTITIDAQGIIWIGTIKGVSRFDGINFVTLQNFNIKDRQILSSIIDAQGNKWFGTFAYGVTKFDGNSFTTYDASLEYNSSTNTWYLSSNALSGRNVYSVAIESNGDKWFCTENAISMYNGTNWVSYGGFHNEVVIDDENNKWIFAGRDLSKFDGITRIYYSPPVLKKLSDVGGITCMLIDQEGRKWFGVRYGGISVLSDSGSGPLLFVNKPQIGLVYLDQNANGRKDPNELNIAGQIVKLDNNYTTTQNNGIFYTSLNNGSHTFTYRPKPNWQLTTDSSITVNVTDAPIKDTLYFGVQAISNRHKVEAKLTGTATRPGFQSKSWINYSNLGTLAENGTVSYTLADEASLVQTIPTADSVIGKRLVWKYSNLIPNEQRQISITTQMPGVNFLGDTLVSISKIKSAFSENSDTLKQVLTGSYDPNDKLVAQGMGSKGYVLFGKELEYTVRFQNTGTDTAFNVNIRDTLDLNLDVASLQIVASSHPVKLDLRGQNEAIFRFEKIKLPNKTKNDLGSNGFVKYTIRPKKNLAENTPVKNKAYIYFDFNPAIITNETANTYVSFLPAPTGIDHFGFQSNKSASIFPNPAKDEFTIVFPQTGTYEISLANIQGKSIKTWNEIVGQETTLSVEGVEPGMYLYTAQGRNGQKYVGKLVVGR